MSTGPRRFLAERVRDSVGHLVDAVSDPHVYGALTPAEVSEVARATERLVDLIVTALVTDGRLRASEQRFLRRLGTRRARQGIPFDQVAVAFARATSAGFSVMKDAAMEWPDPSAAWDTYAAMAGELCDLVQAGLGFVRDGYEEWGHSSGGAGPGPSSVEEVFEGVWATADEVIEHGRTLGCALTQDAVLVIALALDAAETERLRSLLGEVPDVPSRHVVVGRLRAMPVPHVPAVFALQEGTDDETLRHGLAAWARAHRALVVVEPVEDVTQLPAAYRAVRDELALVAAAARVPGIVDRARVLLVPRVLSVITPEDAHSFVRSTLGGVLARPPESAEPLLDTLHAAYAWQGDHEELATFLSLSVSGLRTRLARVRQLTGRHHRRDRMALLLALLLFRIHRPHFPPIGDPHWQYA